MIVSMFLTRDSRPWRGITDERAHAVVLALVLLLGFALRLAQPTLVEFKRDEATIARLGQAIAHESALPAVGVDSSLGIDNLPLTLYLAALPLRLWSDPLSLVVFTCLLNSLALVACYALTRAGLGRTQALLATLLFAVSPWAVLYARKIWSRTLPLATLAFAASLWLTFARRRKWALVGAFISLAALLGLRLEALAFVPILGLAILLYRDAVDWRPLLVGTLVFVVVMLPYVVHDIRQGWPNARGLMGYAGGGGSFSWDAVRFTTSLLGGRGIDGQVGPYHARLVAEAGPLWWLNDVLTAVFAGSLVYGVAQAVTARSSGRRRIFALLLLWIAIPVLLQLQPSAPTQRHYYVMHYPAQYMLMAALLVATGERLREWAVARRRERWWRALRGAGALALAVFAVWQVTVTVRLRTYMVAHPSTGGYGVPLRYTRQIARAAREIADAGEVIVLGEGTQPMLTETPTVFDALLFGVDHRFVDSRNAIVLPSRERTAYVAGPVHPDAGSPALEATLVRLSAVGLVTPGPEQVLPDGLAYRTYASTSGDRNQVVARMSPLAAGIPLANNAVFAAYEAPDVAAPGDEAVVWLAWWLRAAPPVEDYHFTLQLRDSEGGLVAQHDHAAFPSASWRADDLVLSRFAPMVPVDAAPGTYQLRAGIYTYPDVRVVPVVDAAGNPVDDGVTLTDAFVVQ